ncbi:HTH_Tnp_Tc3_2 domain-containing protein [Trichonephila clavipes]|nr:HTH_Tnp_Tc3_2 domain-containing protein [Trichonephila clavipes]
MWLLHLIKEPVAEFQLIVKIIGNKRVSVSKDETKVFRLFPGEVVVLVGLGIGNITSLCIVGNITDVEGSRWSSVDDDDVEFAGIEDELLSQRHSKDLVRRLLIDNNSMICEDLLLVENLKRFYPAKKKNDLHCNAQVVSLAILSMFMLGKTRLLLVHNSTGSKNVKGRFVMASLHPKRSPKRDPVCRSFRINQVRRIPGIYPECSNTLSGRNQRVNPHPLFAALTLQQCLSEDTKQRYHQPIDRSELTSATHKQRSVGQRERRKVCPGHHFPPYGTPHTANAWTILRLRIPLRRNRRQYEQLTDFDRGRIIGLREVGWSNRRIGRHLGWSDMVVARCWQQWITEGRVYRRGGSGRPRNTNDREDRAIRRVATSAPTTSLASIQRHLPPSRLPVPSRETIRRRLIEVGLRSRRPLRRLPLTPHHRQCRLDFCRPRATWSVTDWRRVIFSDESRFSLSADDHRTRVWRRTGQRSDPAFIVERHTAISQGVTVWGAISWDTRSSLVVLQGTLAARRYVDDILTPIVLPMLSSRPGAIYQQDNVRPHTARLSQQCLQGYLVLPWPARSPDLSPIGNCSRPKIQEN